MAIWLRILIHNILLTKILAHFDPSTIFNWSCIVPCRCVPTRFRSKATFGTQLSSLTVFNASCSARRQAEHSHVHDVS